MRQLSYIFYLILFVSFASLGQKKGLNYQAVIIDPNPIEVPGIAVTGQPLMNGKVTLRFTIRNSKGVDYEENQALTTDEFGLVNATIGAGVPKTGLRFETFDAIIWDAELKSLIVAVSFDNGQKYTEVSNQKLNFTPYALYAESVDYKNVRDSPTNLSQFKNDVGYLIPKDLDPLKQDIAKNSATIETNKKATEEKFLATQQTIALIDEKIAGNTKDITSINGTLLDHNKRIEENKSTIISTEQNLSSRIGVVQNITLATQNTVNNLTGAFESLSNKSTNIDLGAGNPSDQLYPTQKATKAYVDNTIYAAVGSGVPDATTLAAGKVQLAGDLGGTAMNPTVPALANKENTANKSTSVQTDGTSNTMYPSVKAVKDYVDQATMGTALQATVDAKADKASPTLTGIPLAPTAVSNTNTTQIATTAFVQQALSAGVVDATSAIKGKIKLTQDLGGTADSPTVPGLALKESLSNKSDNISLGNSTTAYPTQNAVKIYVDNQVSSASIADATDLVKGKIQLGGDLNGLRVVNYSYIDQLTNGNKTKTGFIAQEVEGINNQFVNQSADFIPSVFALAKLANVENTTLQVNTDTPHGFKKGDEVKFFAEGKKEIIKTIDEVKSPNEFTVKGWDAPTENLFVYGKKVNDFRAIDFDQITALSVGAIQELSKQVEMLKRENTRLNQVITKRIQNKQAELEQRLIKLELKLKK